MPFWFGNISSSTKGWEPGIMTMARGRNERIDHFFLENWVWRKGEKAPQVVLVVKNPLANVGDVRDRIQDPGFDPWVRKIPWRKAWQPTPVFLAGESHGQRSLEGYSPQGCRVGHDGSSFSMHIARGKLIVKRGLYLFLR